MHRRQEAVTDPIGKKISRLESLKSSPFDYLSGMGLPEKLVDLALCGVPFAPPSVIKSLKELEFALKSTDTSKVNMVVFGGGTGLSNVVGGDSRSASWPKSPFHGIKEIFPNTGSIVCVTDDGGSTGELLKDLPVVALGDLRHVLLSSIQLQGLKSKYFLSENESVKVVEALHAFFNHRFEKAPDSPQDILKQGKIDLDPLPSSLYAAIHDLLDFLFEHPALKRQLGTPHCLGNLFLAAAIYQKAAERNRAFPQSEDYIGALRSLARLFGAENDTVLPCTTTPATLKTLYANGVMVTGEYKSSQAHRGYAMDRVFVEFSDEPSLPAEVVNAITMADILLFAPGSLYTSLIPVMQVPGIAEAVRENQKALKILISNLWIQKGETDLVREAPQRRFYVSDLIRAYHRNIPGGISKIFGQVMVMKFQEIPGDILQNYALEGKVPIYFDREKVDTFGVAPIEAPTFSRKALEERHVVQHDPEAVAIAIKTLWSARSHMQKAKGKIKLPFFKMTGPVVNPLRETPDKRLREVASRLDELGIEGSNKRDILKVFWHHRDIPFLHLDYVSGLEIIDNAAWKRDQEWDKIFSFYDPSDGRIKIRGDVMEKRGRRFETAFLVALGQSLLGNYVAEKRMSPISKDDIPLGMVYEITLRPPNERNCFFTDNELAQFLGLARMIRSSDNKLLYTRLVNGSEGFTPPGVLMGLTYAWYIDNRFAAHVEYKMSILRTPLSWLIPEQVKVLNRRRAIIKFFRKVVFEHNHPMYDEKPVSVRANSSLA